MPLPTPAKGEEQATFISACMSNAVTKREFPRQKQRVAVCYSQWRRKHGEKAYRKASSRSSKKGRK